ncbi:MAG: DUF6916 family protein [Frankiaceae bacterium]
MSASGRSLSRRTLLRAATLGAAMAAIPLDPLGRASASLVASPATAGLTRSSFTPHLHRPFRLRTADGRTFGTTLVEVSDLLGASTSGDEGRFSLLFRAEPCSAARHGTHRLSRAGFGSLDLFIVPIGRGVDHQHYQAVVNRPA